MTVPTMSAGSRSGVNWMRWNFMSSVSDRVLTVSVLARPGTPSSRTCPPVSMPIRMRSIMAFWPTMTLATSAFSFSTKADCL